MKITPPASATTLKSSSDLLTGIGKGQAKSALHKPKMRHGAQNRPSTFEQTVREAGSKAEPAAKAAEPFPQSKTESAKPAERFHSEKSGGRKPTDSWRDPAHHDNTQPVDQPAQSTEVEQADAEQSTLKGEVVPTPVVQVTTQRPASAANAKGAPTDAKENGSGQAVGQTGDRAPQVTAANQTDEEWVHRITGQALEGAGAVMRQIAGAKTGSVAAAAHAGMTIAGAEDAPEKPTELPFATAETAQAASPADTVNTPVKPPMFLAPSLDPQTTSVNAPAPARAPAESKESLKANTGTTAAPTAAAPDAPNLGTTTTAFSAVSQASIRLIGAARIAPSQSAPRSRDIPDQAAHALTVALHDLPAPAGERIVTMRLNPMTVGQLRIELHVAGDAVAVQIHAGSPKVRAAITKSLGDLKSSVERQGLRVESMGVLEDSALSAPPAASDQATPADPGTINPDGGHGRGQDHSGSPFANSPRSIAGAESPALHPAGDGVATPLTPGVGGDGVLEILTYRLDAVA